MTTWNGKSPLMIEHEVAYRGRPTERVELRLSQFGETIVTIDFRGRPWHHFDNGRVGIDISEFDLIPLQTNELNRS